MRVMTRKLSKAALRTGAGEPAWSTELGNGQALPVQGIQSRPEAATIGRLSARAGAGPDVRGRPAVRVRPCGRSSAAALPPAPPAPRAPSASRPWPAQPAPGQPPPAEPGAPAAGGIAPAGTIQGEATSRTTSARERRTSASPSRGQPGRSAWDVLTTAGADVAPGQLPELPELPRAPRATCRCPAPASTSTR